MGKRCSGQISGVGGHIHISGLVLQAGIRSHQSKSNHQGSAGFSSWFHVPGQAIFDQSPIHNPTFGRLLPRAREKREQLRAAAVAASRERRYMARAPRKGALLVAVLPACARACVGCVCVCLFVCMPVCLFVCLFVCSFSVGRAGGREGGRSVGRAGGRSVGRSVGELLAGWLAGVRLVGCIISWLHGRFVAWLFVLYVLLFLP